MAQIDFSAVIKSLDGKAPVLSGMPPENGITGVLTLEEVCTNALLTNHADEVCVPGEEKYRRFKIAQAIALTPRGSKTAIKSEDVALIKTLIAKIYVPLVVGQAYDFLEQEVPS